MNGRQAEVSRRLLLAVLLAWPGTGLAETGTLTDDAFVSTNPVLQQVNLAGTGPSIVVSGVP
jgi:hypothetical protein